MAAGKIFIGTSGWSYADWRGKFYPPKVKTTDYLPYYTRFLNTVEINGSFYRLPKIETAQAWADKVPKGFKFCPKISSYLTHNKRLKDPEEPLERFFSVFEPMLKTMGPVLVQLHPTLQFNYDLAEHFYTEWSKHGKNKMAMEVRHQSWLSDESLHLMTKYQVAFVISQSGVGFPYAEIVTAKDIYVRFHGPGKLYASLYTNEELKPFAKKFLKWKKEGHTIWVFFNNDWFGYALMNAQTLKEMVGEKYGERIVIGGKKTEDG